MSRQSVRDNDDTETLLNADRFTRGGIKFAEGSSEGWSKVEGLLRGWDTCLRCVTF